MADRERRRRAGQARAAQQSRVLGSEVHVARRELGWSRLHAGREAGLARSTWERIEAGDPRIQLDILCAAASAVGLDLVLRTYPGREPGLRDSGQLTLANRLRELAHSTWSLALELPCGEHGEAADMAFFGATVILHVEIERAVVDLQAQLRRANEKRKALSVRESRPIRLVIVVEDTQRNRKVLEPHRDLVARMLPAGSREILAAVRDGSPLQRDGLLWLRRPPRRRERSSGR